MELKESKYIVVKVFTFLDFLGNKKPLEQDELYLTIINTIKFCTCTKCKTMFPLYSQLFKYVFANTYNKV
jgi:hypothetical protein